MCDVEDKNRLHKDLEAYRKLEMWASGLFLASIALTVQQLVQWDKVDRIDLSDWTFSAPFVTGVAGFCFLRVVNVQGLYPRLKLRKRVNKDTKSMTVWQRVCLYSPSWWGLTALTLAGMPLLLGLAISLVLVNGNPAKWGEPMRKALWIGLPIVVLVGIWSYLERICVGYRIEHETD